MADRYELAAQFKVGQLVRVNDNIDRTTRRHGEDHEGKMRGMIGRTFKITSTDTDRIRFKGFMWAPEDLTDVSEDMEPLPLPKTNFLFDPKELL